MGDEEESQEQGQDNDDQQEKDIRISKEDAEYLSKFIANQKKKDLADSSEEEEQEEISQEENSEEQITSLKKENKLLQKELAKLKEGLRLAKLAELPKKLQGKYKERSLEELGLLVEYLSEEKKSAGLPRTPKEEQERTPFNIGSIGGYNTKEKKWVVRK